MKLFYKLFTGVFLLISFSVIGFFLASNREILVLLRGEAEQNLKEKTSEKGKALENYLIYQNEILRILSKQPILQDPQATTLQIRSFLQSVSEGKNGFYSLSLFDSNRIRLADSRKIDEGKQHKEIEYWKKIQPGNGTQQEIIEFSYSESLQQVVVHFIQTIALPAGSKRILVGRILLRDLLPVFVASDPKFLGLNGQIFLLAHDGSILYSSIDQQKSIGKFNEELKYGWDGQLNSSGEFLYCRQSLAPAFTDSMTLIFGTHQKKTLKPIRDIALTSLKTLLVILLLSSFATFFVSRILTDPVRKLSEAAGQIARGTSNPSLLLRTGDELQVLSVHLQKMAHRLNLRMKEQIKLYAQLQTEHKNTRANILYASRLQKAILPNESLLSKVLNDHFVLYQPKDVVSGDFYFVYQQDQDLVIAVADCTGHGVSGALMAMIGYSLLVQIVQIEGHREPVAILESLDDNMKTMFPWEDWEAPFGMEIGIFAGDLRSKTFSFAGSRIDLILSGTEGIKTFKGSSKDLGRTQPAKGEFSCHKDYFGNGWFYMSSDGYRDQFGGKSVKKFQRKNLNQLLAKLLKQPGSAQKQQLAENLATWKGENPQTDDVLIFGWRLAT